MRAAPRRSPGRWRRWLTRLFALAALGAVVAAVVLTTELSLRHSHGTGTPSNAARQVTLHHVRAGDTLATIAARYHTTIAALEQLNPSVNPQALFPGEALRVGSS